MMRMASNGSLPSIANMMPPAIIVMITANMGVENTQNREGLARFSNRIMLRLPSGAHRPSSGRFPQPSGLALGAMPEWLRSLGYDRLQLKESGTMFVVNKMNISYLAPARLDDQLLSTVSIIKLRHVSMLLHQVIYLLHSSAGPQAPEAKSTRLCEAEVGIVSVNPVSFKPHAFDNIRQSIDRLIS